MIESAELVVSALLARNGQLLVVANDWRPGQPAQWTLPGGAVHPGESLLQAAAREVREESGLQVTAWQRLAYVVQVRWSEPPTHFLLFCFAAADWCGQIQPADPDGYCKRSNGCGLLCAILSLIGRPATAPGRSFTWPSHEILTIPE